MQDHFFYFRDRLRTFRFDGIAGGLQDFVEARLSEWFRNIHEETGARHFAFGGGVANNVKSNLAISELEFVDSLFVPPGPGDDGLPVGAAFCAYYDLLGPEAASRDIAVPGNAYWGTTVDDKALADFDEHPILRERYEKHPDVSSSQLAEILRNGDIIALCFGQMEFGARALGHRSLIADPSNIAAMRRLNDLIKKRDFWMPFTPSILSERFDDYMIVPPNIDATYMTIGFESTALGREHLRAAIHPYDHTVRPQRVTQSVCPIYYSIIKEFERLTGIGAVLNTSLNIHEKPIVLRPTDIIDEIIEGGDISLPYLFVGGHLYVLKS